ncbi:polysaccharide deacetylase family protein [Agromyces cerinus]|uniref:Polysaccharide deacetylase n=1 Tax=Agromyces cerinus subsp. cerinus TaxID=232089 RepID=A0A1N6F6C2_9MICO|nr:polysaccharide deacetylase family protein [Agromyces cerinus]SIN90807.1 Polysaccharide deacetylase [Agromyces cerinus subsp. cerinus]
MTVNLCFHGVGTCVREREPGEAGYWVTDELFLRILDEVGSHPQVRLSFDDGNRSDVAVALPALQERGLRATFFVLAGRLGDPVSLSDSELRLLRDAGMGVGSHGWSHVQWRGMGPDDERRELVEARTALAEASRGPIDEAALPLGRYDRQLLARLRRYGYRAVYTSDRFPARPTAWLQARYSVTAGDTVETVRSMVTRPHRFAETRNRAACLAKRIR